MNSKMNAFLWFVKNDAVNHTCIHASACVYVYAYAYAYAHSHSHSHARFRRIFSSYYDEVGEIIHWLYWAKILLFLIIFNDIIFNIKYDYHKQFCNTNKVHLNAMIRNKQ